MPVSIKGSGGGSVTLDAGAAATDTTLTLPNTTGTLLQSGTAVTVAQGGTGAATLTSNAVLIGNGTSAVTAVAPSTNGNVLTSNGTAWTSAAPSFGVATAVGQVPFSTDGSTFTATQKIVQGTAVASTSGTSIDFTGIPSWVKRISVLFNGVSTSGTSAFLIQLGTASGIESTGYVGQSNIVDGSGGSSGVSSTAGFPLFNNAASAALGGIATICLVSGSSWVESHTAQTGDNTRSVFGGGTKTTSTTLDRIRITTVGGTDTFDAGSINIMYE
jgi:hypothetical protein